MDICGHCGSPNIVSNKLDVAPFQLVSNGTERLRSAGHGAAALGVMTLWGLLSADLDAVADRFRSP